MEAIKKRNIGFGGDKLKILKLDPLLDKLCDKLVALIESKSFVDIKTFLSGEELPLTKLISECFDTRKHYIVIDPPSGRITFKKCVNEKKLVVGDKIIYNDNNICLEGTIVNISNTFQIKCTKAKEYCLDSFSKFIKLAISPYDIESEHWKNLSIEIYESKEKLIWRDFHRRMFNRNLKGTDLHNEAISLENDVYNRIRLCPPSIKSSVVPSKFITVDATISYGHSADKHVEVEQLYKLLVDKKDCIDCLLKLQPVYFIGLSFHGDYNFPCITCWVTAPLSKSILEQLEGIYDGEFRVVCVMMEITNYESESNSGGGSTSGGPSGPSRNNSNDKKRRRFGKRKSEEDEDDDKDYGDSDSDNDGDGDGGDGDDDDDGRSSGIRGRKVIKVTSEASAKCESHIQDFTIRVRIHANIYNDEDFSRMLLIDADVIGCRAGALFNQNWKQLSSFGSGYFLESMTISFFPITNETNNRSALYDQKYYFLKMKNRSVESSVGIEKQGNLKIRTLPKARFQIKKSESTKTVSDE